MSPQSRTLPPSLLPAQKQGVEIYRASLAQRRLWFLNQLQEPNSAYNVPVGLWLYGPLDVAALQASFQEIVDRHETLRTSFALEGNELVQCVIPTYTVSLPVEDFSGLAQPYPPAYELARRETQQPFDLSTGPLFRVRLMRIAPEEHVLLCTMHHTITDAWSMQVLTRELAVLYEARSKGGGGQLPELPIQYGDFAEWQLQVLETEAARKQVEYWKETLRGAPAVLDLPQDYPRPAEQSLQGLSQTYAVPSEIMAEVASLAAQHQATPFMFLLAAFKVLLYRYSGQPDLLVGVPVAGRPRIETEALIGFFVETLVLRDNLSGNPQFLDVLAQVRETTLGALANADVPFEKVVDILRPERNLSYNPVFQVMFSVIKSAIRSHAFGNITAYPYVVNSSTSIVDLFASFIEDSDGKWFLQVDFNTALYKVERIARMVQDYVELLGRITADPEVHIDDPVLAGFMNLSLPQRKRSRRDNRRNGNHRRPVGSLAQMKKRPVAAEAEQAVLVEIWKDVLGVPEIGIRDNFFDVGGHSLLAARLTAQIQQLTGRTIPVSAIFRAPTIETLAILLRDGAVSTPDPVVMALGQSGSGTSFFGVAAPGVDSLGYVLLARHLGEGQSMYKLQSPGPVVWGRPFGKDEIRSLAQQYVSEMRTVQPHGPFCLGAMCDGALIAQEMILQLESVGEEVGFVAIFDTWVLENSQIPMLWAVDYYLERLRIFPRLPFSEQLATMQRTLKRLTGFNGSKKSGWAQAYWPGEDFLEPHFHAPVLLFKRPKQPYYYVRDPEMGWGGRTSGGVEICEVNCGHFEFLRPPYVTAVGKKISERLRKIDERNQATTFLLPATPLRTGTEDSVGSGLAQPSF